MKHLVILDKKPMNRYKGVLQVKDGEIIGHYKSLRDAANKTGIDKGQISKVCSGKKQHRTAGGFNWVYA